VVVMLDLASASPSGPADILAAAAREAVDELPFVRPAEELDDAVTRIAAARARLDPAASRPPPALA